MIGTGMKRLAMAVGAATLVALSLFVAVEAGAPVGGLTHAQATAAARAAFPRGPMTERWALPGPFLLFRGGSSDAISSWRRWVWAINFSGTFPGHCNPVRMGVEPVRCPVGHSATVIVDYVSGEFIEADVGP